MEKLLLISNRRLDESGGRAESFRTRKKFLEENGWEVTVCYLPKPFFIWFIPALLKAVLTVSREDISVINSVSSPPQLQIFGVLLHALTGKPWLVELRDPLATNVDIGSGTVKWYIRRFLEPVLLDRGDKVIHFDGFQIPEQYFEKAYPEFSDTKVEKLSYIGFDRATFESVSPEPVDGFHILYAGSFYDGWIEPYAFLEGLEQYASDNDTTDLTVSFYGDWNEEYQEAAENHGVDEIITTHEFVDYETIVGLMKGADAGLYIGGTDPQNRLNIPSKVFEYIGAKTPILAIVDPEFRSGEVIENEGLGAVGDPRDPDSIASALSALRDSQDDFEPDPEAYNRFTRERNLRGYLKVINEMT